MHVLSVLNVEINSRNSITKTSIQNHEATHILHTKFNLSALCKHIPNNPSHFSMVPLKALLIHGMEKLILRSDGSMDILTIT